MNISTNGTSYGHFKCIGNVLEIVSIYEFVFAINSAKMGF